MQLRRHTEQVMSLSKKSILKGAEEALQYINGQIKNVITHKIIIPSSIDVIAIRKKLHMSRKKFSEEFGFSVRTLEKWERGERCPDSSARAYLTVIKKNPDAVIDALHNIDKMG